MMKADIALEVDCVITSILCITVCGEEGSVVVLPPALRMPQSGAEGAAQGLHCVLQGVGGE